LDFLWIDGAADYQKHVQKILSDYKDVLEPGKFGGVWCLRTLFGSPPRLQVKQPSTKHVSRPDTHVLLIACLAQKYTTKIICVHDQRTCLVLGRNTGLTSHMTGVDDVICDEGK